MIIGHPAEAGVRVQEARALPFSSYTEFAPFSHLQLHNS